ncbi:hypothetical protein ACFL3R_00710 [Thermodesulfobacteriota bacterium]
MKRGYSSLDDHADKISEHLTLTPRISVQDAANLLGVRAARAYTVLQKLTANGVLERTVIPSRGYGKPKQNVYSKSGATKEAPAPTPKTPSNELTEAQTGRAIITYVEDLQNQFRELAVKYSDETNALKEEVEELRKGLRVSVKKSQEQQETIENQRKYARKLYLQLEKAKGADNSGKTFKLSEVARFGG